MASPETTVVAQRNRHAPPLIGTEASRGTRSTELRGERRVAARRTRTIKDKDEDESYWTGLHKFERQALHVEITIYGSGNPLKSSEDLCDSSSQVSRPEGLIWEGIRADSTWYVNSGEKGEE